MEESSPESKPRRSKKPRLSKNQIAYAKSRLQYLPPLSMSAPTTLFMLEASTIKTGVMNRSTQYKKEGFAQETQTESYTHEENGIQIPEMEQSKRFPSLIHFLKAAVNTVTALLNQSEFIASETNNNNEPLIRMSKYTTDTTPIQVEVTSNRTFALVVDPAPLGRIVVWNARSPQVDFNLISSAAPSCFCLHGDGRFVLAGTESGSILLWDLLRIEKTKQSGVALVVQPLFSSDSLAKQNHRHPITAISVFGRPGASVVCALDNGSIATFWHLRNENTGACLVKAETVKLSAAYLPSFSLAVVPGSVNSFIVGCGGRIFNCCRFGSPTSPSLFSANGSVKSLDFSKILPQFFAAGSDSGQLGIYDVSESNPLLELSINLSISEIGVKWSTTRASVLFVSDFSGMRVLIYDFLVSFRLPVYSFKVGSAAQSISVADTKEGTVLAIAEGGMAINVYKIIKKYSEPLTDVEQNKFITSLLNAA